MNDPARDDGPEAGAKLLELAPAEFVRRLATILAEIAACGEGDTPTDEMRADPALADVTGAAS